MNYFDELSRHYSKDKPVAPEEEPEPTVECEHCNEQTPDDTTHVVTVNSRPRTWCPTCHDEDAGMCESCDKSFPSDDLTEVAGRNRHGRRSNSEIHLCPDCLSKDYSSCGSCNTYHHNDDMTSVGKDPICHSCYEDNYFHCDSCNEDFPTHDYGDNGQCQSCNNEDEDEEESNLIHGYNYKPEPIFHGKGRFLGAELESVIGKGAEETTHETAQDTLNKLNGNSSPGGERKKGVGEDFAYLKEDGSLSGMGKGSFEIVTHPATLAVHKEKWAEFLENIPAGLTTEDDLDDGVGLHIHVDKAHLTELQICKMSRFLTAKKNREFVTKIAGRSESSWAKLNDNKDFAKRGKRNSDRFEALNLQNTKTVEFRLFKATIDPEKFFSRMEFVDALTEFCKMGETSISDINHNGPESFKAFVQNNKKIYPSLHNTCQEHTKEETASNYQGEG